METPSKTLRGAQGPDAAGQDPEGEPQIEAAHSTPSPPKLSPAEVRAPPVRPIMEVDAEQSQVQTNATRPDTLHK